MILVNILFYKYIALKYVILLLDLSYNDKERWFHSKLSNDLRFNFLICI